MESTELLIDKLENKQTQNGSLDKIDADALAALYAMRDREKETPTPGEQFYKKPDSVPHRGVIDLFCLFSEKLELSVNEPTIEFMHRRINFLEEESDELRQALHDKDIVEIIDGAADVAFVAITQIFHAFRMLGATHLQAESSTRMALLEVGKTNAVKIVPSEKGAKICKPEGWQPPRIQELVNRYVNNQETDERDS